MNGVESSKKCTKLFEYFRSKIAPKGILFLQETHSNKEEEKKMCDDLKGQIHFSHSKTNSCGVLIAFLGVPNYYFKSEISDNAGRILILEVEIDGIDFLLVNFYNANTETEQLKITQNLSTLLKQFEHCHNKNVIFVGDFNLFFNRKLESSGGNPIVKIRSISKIFNLLEDFDLCDIWRIRNPKTKQFTFRQKHFSGVIQRILDYLFISNSLQESVGKIENLNSLQSDHLPIKCCFNTTFNYICGKGLWKFNNSLVENKEYVEKMIAHIEDTVESFENDMSDHSKWEFLKYQICKFTIKFSKELAQKARQRQAYLENKIKELELLIIDDKSFDEYTKTKSELEKIYDNIAEGIKIQSKSNWYQNGEKCTKFFLNLEKRNASNSTIKKLISDDEEVNEPKKICSLIENFYKNLFRKSTFKNNSDINNFLLSLPLPKINSKFFSVCEKDPTEKELFDALKGMENNKTPGNDGLTKEF